MNALRLAFGLFTAVPVGRLPEVGRRSAGAAMLLAPLTTAPLLLVLTGAHLLVARMGVAPLVVAALVLACEALATRAMHLDGLADTADGLSAGYDAESSLRAMKASDVGPSGVAAVVLVLLLQAACLAALLPSRAGLVSVGLAWLASRQVLAWACRRGVTAARPTGLGAMVAGTVPAGAALAGSLAAVVAAGAAGTLAGGTAARSALVAVAVVGAAVLGALAVVRRARTRLGGVSGDVFGAVVEVALSTGLLAAVLLVR